MGDSRVVLFESNYYGVFLVIVIINSTAVIKIIIFIIDIVYF